MNFTAKLQALLPAALTAVSGFISWLLTVPPEVQSGWLGTLVEITPVQYRANVSLFFRGLTFFSGIYATYRAAQSGPKPPTDNTK